MFPILIAGALLLAHTEEKTNCSASDTILLEYVNGEIKPMAESILRIQANSAKIFRSCSISIVLLDVQQQQNLPQITQDRIYEIESLLLLEGVNENIIETKSEIKSKIKMDKNKIGLVFRFQPLYSRALSSNSNPDCQRDTSIEQPFSLKLSLRYCDLKQAAILPTIQPSIITQQASNKSTNEVTTLQQFKFENPEALSVKVIWQNSLNERKQKYYLEKFQTDCNCWNSGNNDQFAIEKAGKIIYYSATIRDSGDYRIISKELLAKKTYGLVCPSFVGIKKAHIESVDGINIPVTVILGGKGIVVELAQEPENYTLIADFIALDGKKYVQQKILLTACYKETEKAPSFNENSTINSIKAADLPAQFGRIPVNFSNNLKSESYEN